MKKIVFIFLYSLFSFSQNGKVIYSISLNSITDVSNENIKKYINIADKNSTNLSFILLWNEFGMKFITDNSNNIKDEDLIPILQIADIEGTYYRKNGVFDYFREIPKTKFYESVICKGRFFTNWKFSDETKIIAGYLCKKADCVLAIDYGDGEPVSTYPITAWYCPQIKTQYGPKGFGNLPGLILEVKQNFVTFSAVSVDLDIKKISVSLPENIKIIKEMDLTNFIENSTNHQ